MAGSSRKRLASDESAATAVEYGLLVAIIALSLITVLSTLGSDVTTILNRVGTAIRNVS